MAITSRPGIEALIADKAALRQILEEQDRLSGFVLDPTVTHQQLRESMIADGVRPEENVGSREILRIREEE